MTDEKRIASLDGLRAVSIAMVVISHSVASLTSSLPYLGNFGVKVFFVISGFLITTILAAEFEKTGSVNLKKFYLRRTLRIFPAFYFYVFCILFATLIGVFQIQKTDFISPLTYTSNYFPPDALQLSHSWSLAVEEQFYLIFPGLLVLLGLKKTKKLLILVVLAAPVLRALTLFYQGGNFSSLWMIFAFQTNMDALAVGCLLALYQAKLHAAEIYRKFLSSSAAFTVLPLVVAAIFYNPDAVVFLYIFGWSLLNIAVVLAVDWLIVNHKSRLGKLFNIAPVKYIGVLSYSIYLWQQPFTVRSEGAVWTYFPLNFALMAGFSLFSYYAVEKTFLNLRHRIES